MFGKGVSMCLLSPTGRGVSGRRPSPTRRISLIGSPLWQSSSTTTLRKLSLGMALIFQGRCSRTYICQNATYTGSGTNKPIGGRFAWAIGRLSTTEERSQRLLVIGCSSISKTTPGRRKMSLSRTPELLRLCTEDLKSNAGKT